MSTNMSIHMFMYVSMHISICTTTHTSAPATALPVWHRAASRAMNSFQKKGIQKFPDSDIAEPLGPMRRRALERVSHELVRSAQAVGVRRRHAPTCLRKKMRRLQPSQRRRRRTARGAARPTAANVGYCSNILVIITTYWLLQHCISHFSTVSVIVATYWFL